MKLIQTLHAPAAAHWPKGRRDDTSASRSSSTSKGEASFGLKWFHVAGDVLGSKLSGLIWACMDFSVVFFWRMSDVLFRKELDIVLCLNVIDALSFPCALIAGKPQPMLKAESKIHHGSFQNDLLVRLWKFAWGWVVSRFRFSDVLCGVSATRWEGDPASKVPRQRPGFRQCGKEKGSGSDSQIDVCNLTGKISPIRILGYTMHGKEVL